MRARRTTVAVVACLVACVLSACVRMPDSGPVVEADSEGSLDAPPAYDFNPNPPEPGEPPDQIVADFLEAMTATPISTNVARQYLSNDADAAWQPDAKTITYADSSRPSGAGTITVKLSGADWLDRRGTFRGALPPDERSMRFPMTIEDGEWRIAEAPDALVVPASWFEQRFRPVSLYFFDPSAQIMVPEPVFVQRGDQFTTALTAALLRGPGPSLARVSRSFIPPGLDFDLSVPVSAEGVAELGLRGYSGQLTPEASELMMTQIAWTLGQEPSIEAVRVTIGGRQVTSSSGQSLFSVDEASIYDPTGLDASSLLYGLRDGRMVSGQPDALAAVPGPMGARDYGARSVAVTLDGTTAAAVTGEGRSVLVSSVPGPRQRVEEVVSGAQNLLRPAYDFANRLWLVDATDEGAVVSFVRGDEPRELEVPGITGRKVTEFLVSRDGSRMVAVVRGRTGDHLWISRLERNDQGAIVGATHAQLIGWQGERDLHVRDIAWTTPTSIAVLHRVARQLVEVRTLSVDGSPSGADDLLTQLTEPVLALAGSPAPLESLYAVTRGSLRDLSRGDTGDVEIDEQVRFLDYVG